MDLLDELARSAQEVIASGYYDAPPRGEKAPSLRAAIAAKPRAIIAEVKPASPTRGAMRSPEEAHALVKGLSGAGVAGLSILTEPRRFHGSLQLLAEASGEGIPTLMKDFVLSEAQLRAGKLCGASAVLLIATLYVRGQAQHDLPEMVRRARKLGMEVVVEAASLPEFELAQSTDAEIIGINNRDLRTMEMDLGRTRRVLSSAKKDRPVIGMSGVESRADADALFAAGCDAILVGTGLMSAADPVQKVKEFL